MSKSRPKAYSQKLKYDQKGRAFLAITEMLYLQEARKLLDATDRQHPNFTKHLKLTHFHR